MDRDQAREAIYGMPQSDWKALYQPPATSEQLALMAASVALNLELRKARETRLDGALEKELLARDPPTVEDDQA